MAIEWREDGELRWLEAKLSHDVTAVFTTRAGGVSEIGDPTHLRATHQAPLSVFASRTLLRDAAPPDRPAHSSTTTRNPTLYTLCDGG